MWNVALTVRSFADNVTCWFTNAAICVLNIPQTYICCAPAIFKNVVDINCLTNYKQKHLSRCFSMFTFL